MWKEKQRWTTNWKIKRNELSSFFRWILVFLCFSLFHQKWSNIEFCDFFVAWMFHNGSNVGTSWRSYAWRSFYSSKNRTNNSKREKTLNWKCCKKLKCIQTSWEKNNYTGWTESVQSKWKNAFSSAFMSMHRSETLWSICFFFVFLAQFYLWTTCSMALWLFVLASMAEEIICRYLSWEFSR